MAIVRERVPGATEALAVQVSAAAGRLRTLDLQKSPGTAEVIDWVQALHVLGLPFSIRPPPQQLWGRC